METPTPRRPVGHGPQPATQSPQPIKYARRDKKRIFGFVALGIAIIILVGLIFLGGTIISQSNSSSMRDVKTNQYQAVFLSNNQVYFGKIASINSDQIVLKDIYYLQVQQGVQPEEKAAQDNQQLSLAKLGGELHGPEDTMFINSKQILFWENLKDDGKVVQAIKSHSK